MKRVAYMTTSWDDGHPLDGRVAELLTRYGLRGTFYEPRTAERETMTSAQVRELSATFEMGGHTVHHVDLTQTPETTAQQEILESKSWLEECTGAPCPMFCPPKGRYTRRHLELIRRADFTGLRSVELLSLKFPRPVAGLLHMPTTVQAFPHGWTAYARNTIKRGRYGNLWRYLVRCRSADWTSVARSLLHATLQRGGVFHLWGHSWELEETGQWRQLEEVLRFMSQFTSQAPALTNGQVCQLVQGTEIREQESAISTGHA